MKMPQSGNHCENATIRKCLLISFPDTIVTTLLHTIESGKKHAHIQNGHKCVRNTFLDVLCLLPLGVGARLFAGIVHVNSQLWDSVFMDNPVECIATVSL